MGRSFSRSTSMMGLTLMAAAALAGCHPEGRSAARPGSYAVDMALEINGNSIGLRRVVAEAGAVTAVVFDQVSPPLTVNMRVRRDSAPDGLLVDGKVKHDAGLAFDFEQRLAAGQGREMDLTLQQVPPIHYRLSYRVTAAAGQGAS